MSISDEDARIYTMSKESPVKAVLKMGVPLVAGMFIMVLYNLVDTYFIGLTHDDYQMAAVNLSYPVMMIMIALSNMIGTGASSLIARCLGESDRYRAEKTLTAGMALTAALSLAVAVTGLLLIDGIVGLLGAKEMTFTYTKQYVAVLFIGSIFTMGNYIAGQLLRSEGSVKLSIAGMITGTIVNIVLDPVFIFVLGMQIKGAAAATVIGNAAGMAVSLYFYITGRSMLRPALKSLIPPADITAEIFRVGVPASLETLLTSAAYIVNNNLASAYGDMTVAAIGIVQKVMSVGSYIYQGFAAGVQPVMGYNYGAKDYRRMKDILKAGVFTVTSVELGVMLVYGIFAPYIIRLFSQTAAVIDTGTVVLRTLMFILPFVGTVSMCRMTFQAIGMPGYAFGITLVRQLILYIPLLLIFDRLFRFYGMIWAQPVTELIMMGASLLLLYHIIGKEEKTLS